MWQPQGSMTQEFVQLLHMDESEEVDDQPVLQEVEVDNEVNVPFIEIMVYDTVLRDDDDVSSRKMTRTSQRSGDTSPGQPSSSPHRSRSRSPLPTQEELPRFVVGELQSPKRRGGRSGRGGRGRGRGRWGLQQERLREWVRGQPFVQKYISDDDLPEEVRAVVGKALVERRRKKQVVRESKAAEDLLNEEERLIDTEEFFDAEEFLWQPMDEWRGVRETFTIEHPGPTERVTDPYEAFRAFWDDSILSHLVDETNRYAQEIRSDDFQRKWYPVSADELLLMFAFWIMLGIIKMPSIKSCFSNVPILRTEVFRTMFSEARYWNINRAFQLVQGSQDVNDRNSLLQNMGPVLDHLNHKFQQCYKMQQDICIDESSALGKRPLGFKQFIQTKSVRFGIKTYQLCESATGYLWSFLVDIGRASTPGAAAAMPSSSSYALKLIRPLLNVGHTLFMDSLFNSPGLARFLKRNKTDCVGTLRPNCKNVPPEIKMVPLAEGQFYARQSGDVAVFALQDRQRLNLLSTYHGVEQVHITEKPGRSAHFRLNVVNEYNKGMAGASKLDQMLEPYYVERKRSLQLTKKLFKELMNISIQNARVIVEQSTSAKMDTLVFRLTLVQTIINKHLDKVQKPPKQ